MTYTADAHTTDDIIIGPFSAWPKRPEQRLFRPRNVLFASMIGGAGLFAHCIVPMIA